MAKLKQGRICSVVICLFWVLANCLSSRAEERLAYYLDTSSQSLNGALQKYNTTDASGKMRDFIIQKKYQEAIDLCSSLLESSPDDNQLHYLRGLLSHKIGNLKQAIKDYNFLITKKDADAKVFNNLGVIYVTQKEYEKAKEMFMVATMLSADMIEAHSNLAQLYMETKGYYLAINEFKKVIELEPVNTAALYKLGLAYAYKGDFLKAREQWEKVLAITPEDSKVKKALENLNKEIINRQETLEKKI